MRLSLLTKFQLISLNEIGLLDHNVEQKAFYHLYSTYKWIPEKPRTLNTSNAVQIVSYDFYVSLKNVEKPESLELWDHNHFKRLLNC